MRPGSGGGRPESGGGAVAPTPRVRRSRAVGSPRAVRPYPCARSRTRGAPGPCHHTRNSIEHIGIPMKNRKHPQRRTTIVAAGAAVASLTAALALAPPASAATRTVFVKGHSVLTIFGDAGGGTLIVGRDREGAIEVNGRAVHIHGARATVANVRTIVVFGGYGDDRIAIDEQNGSMPSARLHGGLGDDELFGGSGNDRLYGG